MKQYNIFGGVDVLEDEDKPVKKETEKPNIKEDNSKQIDIFDAGAQRVVIAILQN